MTSKKTELESIFANIHNLPCSNVDQSTSGLGDNVYRKRSQNSSEPVRFLVHPTEDDGPGDSEDETYKESISTEQEPAGR